MSKKNHKIKQNLFHLFIQNADRLPAEASIFPQFQYMDQSIRRIFNQLKKTKEKRVKELVSFEEFWDDLDNDDKVSVYCTWTKLLNTSLELEKNPNIKLQPLSVTLEDQINIKKVSFLNAKWERKNVKLTPTHFIITSKSKHNKQYGLKDYEIKKERSSHNFSWALQPINKNGKYLQCGVSSQTMFDQWFNAMKTNINNQRILYFLQSIKQQKLNPGSVRNKYHELVQKQEERKNKLNKIDGMKTLTQIMIAQQMKMTEGDNFSDFSDKEEFHEFEEKVQEFKETQKTEENQGSQEKQSKTQIESNPNIFKRLIPEYHSLMNFADTPVNSSLLFCQNDYRIYELPSRQGQEIILKFFTVLPYPKTLIFQAIGSQSMAWNDEIDMLTVKTKISSQNTVLIYEKNKPQGILYRERDFLYLRHCFSILNYKQKNTFLIDKSIDSIHHPPFMTVVRAERQLIWGLIEKQSGKQCILIVEGWIKGGGYMNQIQNKEMTLKYMKKLTNLNGFLKQISFQQRDKVNILFKQDWMVDIIKQDEYPQRRPSNFSQQKSEEKSLEQEEIKQAQLERKKTQKQEQQLAQFVMRTNEQLGSSQLKKSEVILSDEKLIPQNYAPPAFNSEKFVIIPQEYLKIVHSLEPLQKPKKGKLFPHVRGHHLWKGQWAILPAGGLGYVDAQKMQEQKKVLTYIIKRIGKNIFSGKGILNISLPVDIFCVESNIQRLAMSFGYFPNYLERASVIKQPQIQLKYIVSSVMGSSLIYLTMQKPFNPILGETYQCWVDNCPIYFEQISHHPPIAAFLMKGRGYTVSGCVEAKMDLSINSGTGNNEGIFKIQFDNGNTFYCTTPAGCLTGLTYGDRKLNMVGKAFFWTDKGLFLQINYNPALKTKGFFGGAKGEGDQKLPDYFEGQVRLYPIQAIKEICFKKGETKQISIIPKGPPNCQPTKTYYKVCGRWNKYVMCGDEKTFDVDQNRYYATTDEKYPLASHSNYREDIVYRRMKNFITSQDFKQVLEIRQRQDRKLRARFGKTTAH